MDSLPGTMKELMSFVSVVAITDKRVIVDQTSRFLMNSLLKGKVVRNGDLLYLGDSLILDVTKPICVLEDRKILMPDTTIIELTEQQFNALLSELGTNK